MNTNTRALFLPKSSSVRGSDRMSVNFNFPTVSPIFGASAAKLAMQESNATEIARANRMGVSWEKWLGLSYDRGLVNATFKVVVGRRPAPVPFLKPTAHGVCLLL